MRNNGRAVTVASVAVAWDRTGLIRRMTVLTLAAAAAVAAASLPVRPAGAETAASGFVYTADEHGDTVSRIDLQTSKTDTFRLGIMPHNVQFVPGSDLLLAVGVSASNDAHGGHGGEEAQGHEPMEPAGRLLVLDATDLAAGPIASIPAGTHPAHVIANPDGNRAFVTNSEADSVSVIDLEKGTTVATIPTGDYPHGLRMSPDAKWVYVANVKDGTVSALDAVKLHETTRIEVGAAPVQVGFTPDGSRVYVSLRDENKVAVIDTATRRVIGRIEVGRSPIQVHATPDGRFVYVANQGSDVEPGDTVSVIDVAGGTVVKMIRTGAGAHGVAVSDDGAFVFVTNIIDDTVSQISVKDQSVVRTYPVGKGPNGITFRTSKSATAYAD